MWGGGSGQGARVLCAGVLIARVWAQYRALLVIAGASSKCRGNAGNRVLFAFVRISWRGQEMLLMRGFHAFTSNVGASPIIALGPKGGALIWLPPNMQALFYGALIWLPPNMQALFYGAEAPFLFNIHHLLRRWWPA